MNSLVDVFDAEQRISELSEWRKWMEEIPSFPTKEGWSIKPLPPFAGAVVRVGVTLANGTYKSIYLDCYDRLGIYGEPYWEVHPVDGDCGRCAMSDVEELVRLIEAKP